MIWKTVLDIYTEPFWSSVIVRRKLVQKRRTSFGVGVISFRVKKHTSVSKGEAQVETNVHEK